MHHDIRNPSHVFPPPGDSYMPWHRPSISNLGNRCFPILDYIPCTRAAAIHRFLEGVPASSTGHGLHVSEQSYFSAGFVYWLERLAMDVAWSGACHGVARCRRHPGRDGIFRGRATSYCPILAISSHHSSWLARSGGLGHGTEGPWGHVRGQRPSHGGLAITRGRGRLVPWPPCGGGRH